MKKLLIIILICFSLAASAVFADANMSITPVSVNFGTLEWGTETTQTFNITNNGDINLTNINFSTSIASRYNASFNQSVFNLGVGANASIQFNITIPGDEDTGNNTADLYIRSDQYNTIVPVLFDIKQRLSIYDLSVKVGGETDSGVEDGDKIDKEAEPNDEVIFEIETKNLFDSDDDDSDIKDITVKITIEGIDDNDDLKGETEDFDLDAEKKSTKKITITIPERVEEGTYNVSIKIDGENADTSTDYTVEWNLKLELEKKRHNIIIKKYELSPSVIKCSGTAKLNVKLLNLGRKKESDAILEIKNSDLGLNTRIENIKLDVDYDEDAEYSKSIDIYVANDINAGTYPITVNVYYDDSKTKLDDQKSVDLKIEACGETTTEEETPEEGGSEQEETEEVEEETEHEELVVEEPGVETGFSEGFRGSGTYIALLGLIALAVIITAVLFLAKFIGKE